MKKLILLQLIVNFTILQFAYSQGGSWAWLGGDTLNSIQSPDGIYGTQGVPSPNNWPPDVYGSAYWTGNDGNFYLLEEGETVFGLIKFNIMICGNMTQQLVIGLG